MPTNSFPTLPSQGTGSKAIEIPSEIDASGQTIVPRNLPSEMPLTSVENLVAAIETVFRKTKGSSTWVERKGALFDVMNKAQLSLQQLEHYLNFDPALPYTRNLISGDDKNYTLLLLCWSPSKESKIHGKPTNLVESLI